MTVVAAAVVPVPPLLVPEVAGGSAAADADLRARVDEAVAALVATGLPVVVVAPGPETVRHEPGWDWRGFGVPGHHGAAGVPHAAAVGCWLLHRHGVTAAAVQAVSGAATVAELRTLGTWLAAGEDVALLVCGDGSACRDEKAPGHLDARATGFDAAAAAALGTGDVAAVLALDPRLAGELMAAGLPAWKVLAGAWGDSGVEARLLLHAAPYGVGYLVALWSTPGSAIQSSDAVSNVGRSEPGSASHCS